MWLRAVRRSALVLLSGALEAYLEAVVEEALDRLIEHKHPGKAFPEGIRKQALRRLILRKSGSLGPDALDEILALESLLRSATETPTLDDLAIKAVKDEFGNPTPKGVDKLLGYLGVVEASKTCTYRRQGTTIIPRGRLNALLQWRNDIAHGNPDRDPEIEKVEEYQDFVRGFAYAVDRAVAVQLCTICGENPWYNW